MTSTVSRARYTREVIVHTCHTILQVNHISDQCKLNVRQFHDENEDLIAHKASE